MVTTLPARLETIIHRIHAATGTSDGWERAMAGVRGLMRGRAAILAKHDFVSGRGEWLQESPLNPEERAAYAEEHSVRNPWFISSLDYRPGRILAGDEVLATEALLRTDFYHRHLKRLGLFHRLCGVVARHGETVYYVDVLRARQQRRFDDRDRKLLQTMLRHLSLSFAHQLTLQNERFVSDTLRTVVDRVSPALFVVDVTGQVLFSNSRAAEFLAEHQSVRLKEQRLAAASRAEDRMLQEVIREVAAAEGGASDAGASLITLSEPKGNERVVVTAYPAGDTAPDQSGRPRAAAILVVRHPDRSHDMSRCPIIALYRLTPAEGRLAGLILSGHSLAASADRLQVSENTVRSHLKQIYQKTGTHGQVDLVHLHARVCAVVA